MKYHNKQRRPKKKYRIGKCYNSGVHGHIDQLSHQKEQKKEKPHQASRKRSPPNRNNSLLYCYFSSSSDFGHRAIDYMGHARNINWFNKRYQHIPHFLGHIRCFVCDNVGHKAKDCKLHMCFRRSN